MRLYAVRAGSDRYVGKYLVSIEPKPVWRIRQHLAVKFATFDVAREVAASESICGRVIVVRMKSVETKP